MYDTTFCNNLGDNDERSGEEEEYRQQAKRKLVE